jgi:hypothetical protein
MDIPMHRYMCVIEKGYTKDAAMADCLGRKYYGRNNV